MDHYNYNAKQKHDGRGPWPIRSPGLMDRPGACLGRAKAASSSVKKKNLFDVASSSVCRRSCRRRRVTSPPSSDVSIVAAHDAVLLHGSTTSASLAISTLQRFNHQMQCDVARLVLTLPTPAQAAGPYRLTPPCFPCLYSTDGSKSMAANG